MNEEQFWKKLLLEIEADNTVVLAIIIRREGSAPNVPGAKMFVTLDNLCGTIGGGISEHKLVEDARALIEEEKFTSETIHLEHNDKASENRSGMICSGSQTFALIPLTVKDKNVLEQIVEAYSKTKPGNLTLNEDGISIDFNRILSKDKIYVEENGKWFYRENVGMQNKLFVIGGGHVSLSLSRIMETLDFHITVFDDRDNLPTMLSNSYANEKRIISYENIEEYIPEGNNIYVIIMTFAHISDERVLEKMLSRKYAYLGMMASTAKKKQIFDNLKEKGISKTLLKKVYSPIGVSIKSDTPEEIAVSIAAEIIKVKNSFD
ncbi:MAG: XdhC family protein [Candidatus Heimdallarchaeota archaeon]|nr:XdhC family protein [Candidatus Heimdallarchaeota archaeon]